LDKSGYQLEIQAYWHAALRQEMYAGTPMP